MNTRTTIFTKLSFSLLLLSSLSIPLHSAMPALSKDEIALNSFRYVLKLHEDLPNTDPKEAFDRLASIKVWEIEAFEKEDFLLPQKT
ncbi:MAG: hypothetical protein AAF335_05205, partial [Bacteroidota bacterium]